MAPKFVRAAPRQGRKNAHSVGMTGIEPQMGDFEIPGYSHCLVRGYSVWSCSQHKAGHDFQFAQKTDSEQPQLSPAHVFKPWGRGVEGWGEQQDTCYSDFKSPQAGGKEGGKPGGSHSEREQPIRRISDSQGISVILVTVLCAIPIDESQD